MSVILEIKGATKRYGGLVAVNDVSFIVNEGEILSVIGPNGAGKSTLFKLIASFVQTSAGEVLLRGERISDLAPHTVARKGVVRTFQETTIFKSMTVRENIIVAHHLRSRASLLGFFLGTGLAKADEALFSESADASSISWACKPSAMNWPPTCRKAICARSGWPSALRPSRRCCCWTNPLLA